MTTAGSAKGGPGRTRAKLSVAVVQGGPSTEAEVSRASGAGVAKALDEAGHRATRVELDVSLAEALRGGGFDVVFPVAHGAVGEDGSLQGLLEVLGLPYVGSGVLSSALAMHKRVARVVMQQAGLPVANGLSLSRGDAMEAAHKARRELGARVVVKPSSHGSAIGVSRLDENASLQDVAAAIGAVWEMDDFAVVEHFVRGREVTCGVIEGVLELERATALPPTEILSPRDPFYTYEARYAPGRSVHVCPANLPPELVRVVQELAVRAHGALSCRDLSRVDFVVADPEAPTTTGEDPPVTVLEVNTLPGMTATSLFPEAASVAGLSMPSLCDALASRAHARGPARRLEGRPLPR